MVSNGAHGITVMQCQSSTDYVKVCRFSVTTFPLTVTMFLHTTNSTRNSSFRLSHFVLKGDLIEITPRCWTSQ